ncbi:MAG: hypothetical protein AAF290_12345 [Pseudomonadota bacterium]
MTQFLLRAAALLLLSANSMSAGLDDMLPADSQWYLHIDLEQMRSGGAGETLYNWLNSEVFDDLRDDVGFDPDKELNAITAYSSGNGHATMIVSGDLSSRSQDKMLAALVLNGNAEPLKRGGMNYYRVEDIDIENEELQVNQDVLYVTFDKRNTWVLSTQLEEMEAAFSGKARGIKNDDRSLLILSARNPLMQAGVDAERMSNQWDSGMLRNTRQIAFKLADNRGKADIEVRVTAKDETTSNALASIVRGLIGLQALSGEGTPELSQLLNRLRIENDAEGLSLSLTVEPDLLVSVVNQ